MSSAATTSSDEVSSVRPQRWHLVVGSVAAALAICGLAWIRRKAEWIDLLYDAGDVLDTHKNGLLTQPAFHHWLAHIEVAVFAVVFALYARTARSSARAGVLATIASFVVVFADSVVCWTTKIGGRTYMLIYDDALISMRYARNFADGNGLVYNPGEHVEGFSNLLWTLIMVIPHKLGIHEGMTSVFVVIVGGLLMVGSVWLACSALEAEKVAAPIQIVFALLMFFDPNIFEFTLLGLETPLLGFGACLLVAGVIRSRERWLQIGVVVLVLARADGAVAASMLLGWGAVEEAASSRRPLLVVAREQWRRFALLVLAVSGVIAWRLVVYGHLAPNTYYLKVYALGARIGVGVASYGVRGVFMYGVPAAFVLWAAYFDEGARRARRMLLPVVGVWAYAMYVGGDSFKYMRFLGPMSPVLWTAAALAASAVAVRLGRGAIVAIGALMIVAAPLQSERGVLGFTFKHDLWIRDNILTPKTMALNVPPEESIALFSAGLSYYAPKHRFLDALGKVDEHIAHQKTFHGSLPGHNKFDFAYLYNELKPGVTFTAMNCDEVEARLGAGDAALEATTRGERNLFYAPVYQLLDPTFRDLYHTNRVILRDGDGPAGHAMGCWFVRKGSKVPVVWQLAHE